ncbi:hypothetical protein COCMIDRAFT_34914 [Bipolaris oryzae ATCC 44560]|uniref:Major facilitator superfamily (MFS) profile domain-containing protein n=1 Tax=Bipolaris oryzae ATCC 44560 TaxID=930090 RepID=W6ZC22_COCMI|nr:uncharacterized protein COCMIDRAFT_34914 [Bipolaris oryzae ATCC 44560]EUC47525.1 hypothetical protein COCMIDRAFT_34914 [Bipolaris oryzae ATCC 44560]
MAALPEENRPHSSSGSDTAVSSTYSSDTYISDSEREDEVTEKEVQKTKSNTSKDIEKGSSKDVDITENEIFVEKYPLSDLDNNLVGWDFQGDPTNPRNFPTAKKWLLLILVTCLTTLSPVSSSILAPATPFIDAEFGNTSHILASLTVSVYVLGFSVGVLFLSPLSELYGRYWVLNCSSVAWCGFTLGCALAPNLGSLIVMRFLAGVGGSPCLTIGTGVIADVFVTAKRGLAVSILSLAILFGPIIGPICGGFIAQRIGWRWSMRIIFIAGCVLTGSLFAFSSETYHPVLLQRKTLRLRKELDRPELQNIMTYKKGVEALSVKRSLCNSVTRTVQMLFKSPIVLFCSLYMSFVFGLLMMLFTSLTPVFIHTYGWSPEMTGLAYLGIGVGNCFGVAFVARTSDATIVRLTKKNKGVYEPEMRLPACVFFGLMIPISLFLHGWTAQYHVHWIVPIASLIPFGFGLMGLYAPLQTYMIDSFPQYAASAVAAMSSLRCLVGALLPLSGPLMYEKLGLGWRNSILGFIAVAFIPVPVLLYRYGKVIREKYPVKF